MMRQITTPAGDDATWKQAVPLWGWCTDGSVSAFLKQSR